MALIKSDAFPRSGAGERTHSIGSFIGAIRREVSGRIRERRIYDETMRELWEMPDKYRLELGIDEYEFERFARVKARREAWR